MYTRMLGKLMLASLILGLMAILQPVQAADEGGDKWQFISPAYLWMSGLEGDVTVKGNTAEIDMGFDDIFEHTDVGIQVYLEVRKEKFGFFVQPNYLKLSADGTGPLGGDVELEQTWWIVEFGGFYQIVNTGGERPLTVDAIAGARYWDIKTELDITGAFSFSGESSTSLFDPIIGLRARKYLTEKLSVSVRGDVGGFDLSDDTSNFSWQIVPLVGYDFNKYFSAFAGYRLLATDFSSGSGATEKGADIQMHGALLGFNFDLFGWLGRNK